MIRVYQVQLSNDKIDEVNEKGWGNTAWDKNYWALTNFPGRGNTVDEQFLLAVDDGLVSHTMTIDTDDLDDAFAVGNGYSRTRVLWSAARRKSISVGDLLVTDDGKGYIVAPFGFDEVDQMTVRVMETKVSTHMQLWYETEA